MKYRVDFFSPNAEVEAKDEDEAIQKAKELLYNGELHIEVQSVERVCKQISVEQAEIVIDGQGFTVTYIPTATSGCWYVVHDAFEMWGAVAIDLNGDIVGWRNPPTRGNLKAELEEAIKEAFGIPVQL